MKRLSDIRKVSIRLLFIFFTILNGLATLRAQNPAYFQVNTEDGLPSNEIYSMLIDQRGFLWIGSDAGICKYDGISFISYSNPGQHTRSLTGLAESSSGRIYAYSFGGQIFYIENDSLHELKSWRNPVSSLSCDADGNVWVACDEGVYRFSEKENIWEGPLYPENLTHKWAYGLTPANNGVYSVFSSGLGFFHDDVWIVYPLDVPQGYAGQYILSEGSGLPVVCNAAGGKVFGFQKETFTDRNSQKLKDELSGKRVTVVRTFEDGKIWIGTFDGVVIYDPFNDHVQTIFQGNIISDIIFDREGNCWLSTLQEGLFRIPDPDATVWNPSVKWNNTISLLKLEHHGQQFFFTTAGGELGTLDLETNQLEFYSVSGKADIQSLNFVSGDNTLYFFTSNQLYAFKDKKITPIRAFYPPVKDLLAVKSGYLMASSQGTFFYPELGDTASKQHLCTEWSRKLVFSEKHDLLLVATNTGLQAFRQEIHGWEKKSHVLDPYQVISIATDPDHDQFYALCFDGRIYAVNSGLQTKLVTILDKSAIPGDLIYSAGSLFVATNSGLFSYDLKSHEWKRRTQYSGLASDDIRSVLLFEDQLWLATSKGLQAVSKSGSEKKKNGKIYLKALFKDDEPLDTAGLIELNYDQSLSFMLEAAHYSSNGKYRYAYRLPVTDSTWNFIPANVKKFTIPAVPPGNFILEIKLIDYAGNSSENTITVRGRVIPPFWQRWWFYVFVVLSGILSAFLLFRLRVVKLKQNQSDELKKIRLENELILSQQTALRTQVNPHFVFNVQTAINTCIDKNEKENAVALLGDFSDLVTHILTMSSRSHVKLSDELKVLELYIRLEQALLNDDFSYESDLADGLDPEEIRLPALLILPYISDAFEHGLRYKKGSKKLHLKIQAEDQGQVLVVEISDNGVGRKASETLSSEAGYKPVSASLVSASKRMKLINRKKTNHVEVTIKDITESDQSYMGRLVVLKIWMHD